MVSSSFLPSSKELVSSQEFLPPVHQESSWIFFLSLSLSLFLSFARAY